MGNPLDDLMAVLDTPTPQPSPEPVSPLEELEQIGTLDSKSAFASVRAREDAFKRPWDDAEKNADPAMLEQHAYQSYLNSAKDVGESHGSNPELAAQYVKQYQQWRPLKRAYDIGQSQGTSPEMAAATVSRLTPEEQQVYIESLKENWKKQGKIGTKESIDRLGARGGHLPIIGSIVGADQWNEARKAAEALQAERDGGPALADADRAKAMNKLWKVNMQALEYEARSGQSFLGQVGEGLAQLPAFMLEFMASAGLANAVGGAVSTGLGRVLGIGFRAAEGGQAFIPRGVAGLLPRAAGWTAAGASQAATSLLPRVFEGAEERRFYGENATTAYAKAFADQTIEAMSETSGETLAAVVGKVIDKTPGLKKLYDVWQKATKGKKVDFINKVLHYSSETAHMAGFHGTLEEMGEERVGDALRALTGVQDFNLKGDQNTLKNRLAKAIFPGFERLAAEAAQFAVPGVVDAAGGMLGGRSKPLPEDVAKFFRGNPEAAKDLLNSGKTSRTAFEEVAKKHGLDLPKLNAEERAQVVEELKKPAAPPTEQAQAETPAAETASGAPLSENSPAESQKSEQIPVKNASADAAFHEAELSKEGLSAEKVQAAKPYLKRFEEDFSGALPPDQAKPVLERLSEGGSKPVTVASVDVANGAGINALRGSVSKTNADITKIADMIRASMDEVLPDTNYRLVRKGWKFQVFTQTENQEAVKSALQKAEGRVKEYAHAEGLESAKPREGDNATPGVYFKSVEVEKAGAGPMSKAILAEHAPPRLSEKVPTAKEIEAKKKAGAFLSEKEHVVEQLLKAGWTEAEIAKHRGDISAFHEDRVLQDYGSKSMRDSSVARGIEHAEKTGRPGVYVEVDIGNLGGLTKHFVSKSRGLRTESVAEQRGREIADTHFAAVADILKKHLPEAEFFRHGADELGIHLPDVTAGGARAKLEAASKEIAAYEKANKLDTIKHTKSGREPGFGVVWGLSAYDGKDSAADIISDADGAVEKVKKGEPSNEYRGSSRAARIAALDRQAGGAEKGLGRKGSAGSEAQSGAPGADSRAPSEGQSKRRNPFARRADVSTGGKDAAQDRGGPARRISAVTGSDTELLAPAGKERVPAKFAVVEAGDLIPSHDFRQQSPTPRKEYPAELQPRSYVPKDTNAQKVVEIAGNLDASRLITDAPGMDAGTPTILPNGIVVAGNGRAMGIQRAAARPMNPKQYAEYKRALLSKAAQFGLDPKQIEGLKKPVLVRMVEADASSETARFIASASNLSTAYRENPVRKAAQLAPLVPDEVFDQLRYDPEATFSKLVTDETKGRAFRETLLKAIPAAERGEYFDQAGELTDAGKELVEALMVVKVMPVDLVEKMPRSLRGTLEAAAPQLVMMKRGRGIDLLPALREAIEFRLGPLENGKLTYDDYQGQGQMFEKPKTLSPEGRMLLDFVTENGAKPKLFREALGNLITEADQTGPGSLLGGQEGNEPAKMVADALGVKKQKGATFGVVLKATESKQSSEAELPLAMKNGRLSKDDTLKKAPAVEDGYTRLYRAESPTVKFEDVFDVEKLKKFAPQKNGKFYTSDLSYADYFRETYGKDAKILYRDVPKEFLKKFATSQEGEYVINEAELSQIKSSKEARDKIESSKAYQKVKAELDDIFGEGGAADAADVNHAAFQRAREMGNSVEQSNEIAKTAEAEYVRRRGKSLDASYKVLDVSDAEPPALPGGEEQPENRKYSLKPGQVASVSREDFERTFPGTKVSELGDGWRITFENGYYVDAKVVDKISIDWDEAERTYGRKFSAKERASIGAAGSFEIRTKDGITLDGIGLMQLARGIADSSTIKHESVHLAKRLGLFLHDEWEALVKEHSAVTRSEEQQEEDIAQARELWEHGKGFVGKLKRWARGLLESLGFTKGLDAEDVHRLMDTAEFWRRVPEIDSKGKKTIDLYFGRPELANPARSQEVRDLVDKVDQARKEAGTPGRRGDTAVQKEAKELLDKHYTKTKNGLLKAGREGGQLSDVETVAAKEIINREGLKALKSGDAAKLADAVALIEAYRQTGTEQARGFRQRRDPVETPAQRRQRMIMEGILTPPRAYKLKGEELHKEWAKKVPELLYHLKKLGVDVNDLEKTGENPVQASRALGTIQAAKADNWDAMYEYWRNAILSAPTTHFANVAGNLGHTAWHFTAERMTEALLNTLVQRPSGAQLGEFTHILAGVLPGLSQGARNFVRSFKSETPYFETELGLDGSSKLEEPNVAIEGAKGRIIRISQRLLLAVDEFSKSLIARMDVAAQAYRIAKDEKLSGRALQARMEELTTDTESLAWERAMETTKELTFQEDGGKVTQAAIKFRKSFPGFRYLMPFITTPMNILRVGIRKSPLGSLGLARRVYEGATTGNWKGITKYSAEQVIAWALLLALMNNDDDDPWITGAAVERESRGKRDLAYRTSPPQSVKIGGKWYSYNRLEPFATALSLTVDMLQSLKHGDSNEKLWAPIQSLLGQVKSKSFLSGMGDILDVIEGPEGAPDKLARWASSFAVSWIPNTIRSGGRATQDEIKERGVWGDGPEWVSRMLRRTVQKTELPIVDDVPAYDLWGRTKPRTSSPVPGTDWLYRMLVPINIKEGAPFVGDQILTNWNNEHPEDEKAPLPPSKRYKLGLKEFSMTDEQYGEYSKLAGELTAKVVERLKWEPENPTAADIDVLTDIISDARSTARKYLAKKWNGKDPGAFDLEKEAAELRQGLIHKKGTAASAKRSEHLNDKDREEGLSLKDKHAAEDMKADEAARWLVARGGDPKQLRRDYWKYLLKAYKTETTRAEHMQRFNIRLKKAQ